uniref:Putative ixodes 14 kDa protein n=1 Tax=Ixodes ricinus TaxID=34613 RepID=A0A0K8RCM0_IXORI
MKFYLVAVSGLLAVMSSIHGAKVAVSSETSEQSENTEDPRQPVLCSASPEEQKEIVKCIQTNDTAKRSLGNYSWIFNSSIDVATNICNQSNEYLVEMSDQESESLFNYTLQCEDELGVTTTTASITSSEVEDS